MEQNDDVELVKLIENEINLGFTYLETHRISSSADHANQSLSNAKTSLETAETFVRRLSTAAAAGFQPNLQHLREVIDRADR